MALCYNKTEQPGFTPSEEVAVPPDWKINGEAKNYNKEGCEQSAVSVSEATLFDH